MKLSTFIDSTAIRFLVVGVVNTLVGTGTMFVLYNFFGCSYWASSATNYIVGGICSFFLNKYFTFKNSEHSFKQVLKFIVTVAGCYFVGYGVAKPLVALALSSQSIAIQENIAMCVGMCLYVVLNYLIQRVFVFGETSNVKK